MADFDPRRIPILGHDIYQVGQVAQIVSQPCTPNPWIAVRAFWSYTPTLVWSLFKPEIVDVSFNRASRRHTRIRRRGFEALFTIEMPRATRPGVYWALAHGFQLTERIGWYLLVVDAATDFAVNWTSMAYQFSGCQNQSAGFARIAATDVGLGGGFGPSTLAFRGIESSGQPPGEIGSHSVGGSTFGPKQCVASLKLQWHELVGHGSRIEAAYLVRHPHQGAQVRIPMQMSGDPSDVSQWTAVDTFSAPFFPPCRWSAEVHIDGGSVTCLDGSIQANIAPPGGIEHDP